MQVLKEGVSFYHWNFCQNAYHLGKCRVGLFYPGWFWTCVYFSQVVTLGGTILPEDSDDLWVLKKSAEDYFFSDFLYWFILEVKNTETHSVGSRLFTWLCDWDVPNLRRLKNCLWLNQVGFWKRWVYLLRICTNNARKSLVFCKKS